MTLSAMQYVLNIIQKQVCKLIKQSLQDGAFPQKHEINSLTEIQTMRHFQLAYLGL